MYTRSRITLILSACLLAPVLWACGPYFDQWLLSGQAEFLRAPGVMFERELARLGTGASSRFQSLPATNGYPDQTLQSELSDLGQTLQRSGIAEVDRLELLSRYQQARAHLNVMRDRVSAWRDAGNTGPVSFDALPRIPAGIPAEFSIYLDGCIQFYQGETDRARRLWRNVLDLPPDARRFRSTWAAFMLGKLDVDADPPAALVSFQRVRELAREGLADTLGLAAASYGWEARAQLNLNNPAAAIELYLEQQATGELDAASLRTAALAVLELDSDELKKVVDNAKVRPVVSSCLLSRTWNEDSWDEKSRPELWIKWLNAVIAAKSPDTGSAERFAWIAYQCGQFTTAEEWLPFTDPASPGALWLSAKLMLRSGDIDGAARKLAFATRLAPIVQDRVGLPAAGIHDELQIGSRGGRDRMHGELGVLELQRHDYAAALNTLLLAGYPADAAYVADRVLTLDELKSYVDRFWPATPSRMSRAADQAVSRDDKNRENIRYLLARRLTRNDRGAEARDYYPVEWLPIFDQLLMSLKGAADSGNSMEERARLYWEAAKINRRNGMELSGSALAPDWQIHDGSFWYGGPSLADRKDLPATDVLRPDRDEENRHANSAPGPDKRFHYRYRAAELAWKAARLMPDQSDATAAVLCEAGSWVKVSDPQFADRFYKSLVIRCGHTELGTAADRKRWFPQTTPEGRLDEPMPPPVGSTYSGPWEGDASR